MNRFDRENSHQFELQQLEPYDIDSLHELEKEAFPIDQWDKETMIKESQLTPPRFTTVKDSGRVIAYLHTQMGHDNPSEGFETDGIIGSLAVLHEYRRRGLGEMLLRHGISSLEAQGATRIVEHTREDNYDMIQLSEKLGFQRSGVIPDYYADGASALFLVRPVIKG